MIGWRFPILDGGNEQGFNNSGIETFNGSEMYDNLAREICQNSLDAKDEDAEGPVIVKFTTEDIEISSNEAVSSLCDVVERCEDYWKGREDDKLRHFFDTVKKIRESNTVSVLRIADYNTKGLEGSKAGKNKKSPWRGLTHSDGVSYKNEDSGGSYGIGKNAPFVCSQIRTVFYNTYAKDGEKAFQGIARLMTHYNDGKEETIGTGHFLNCDEKGPIFENDVCEIRDMFKREEYGTDVIIVGFYKTKSWQDTIEKAIVKNFFLAIYEKKLIVYVDNRVINDERLQEILEKHAVTDESVRIYKKLFEARAFDDHIVESGSIMEENDVELFVRLDETYDRNVVEFRNTGMVIRIRRKNVPKSYTAVMVVRGKNLNKLLKAMEPPKHDKWDPDIILSDAERKKGKKFRSDLIRWTNTKIDEICKSDFVAEIDPDGMSQFLPDEFDDGTKKDEKKSEDIEGKTKVEKITIKNIINTNIKTAGQSEGGTPDEGSVNNATSGGENGTETTGAGTSSGGDKVGVPKDGRKIINRPVILKQRIYQEKGGSDTYKAVIMLEDDSNNVFVSVTALGDDGTQETLNIVEYEIAGIKYNADKGRIGPISLKANTMEHIDIKLEFKEKMLLRLDVH